MASPTVRMPRVTNSGHVAAIKRFTLSDIQTKSDSLPNRYVLHAREGFGKTSLAAYTPKPIFLQTRGETGLDTLINNGQLPETPHFPEIQSWEDFLSTIRLLTEEDHEYKTLVIDTVNGAERLCYEFVCQREFNGDWGERGFSSYMKGYEVSLPEWKMFLNSLDDLRRARKMTIFMLTHTKIKTFKNPEGSDYDRWAPDMHEKCWGLTHKWSDAILFGNFETIVKADKNDATKKGKAAATSARILYTQQRPAFDAKNRMGLPEEIEMGSSAQEGWNNLAAAIKSNRKPSAPVASAEPTQEVINA